MNEFDVCCTEDSLILDLLRAGCFTPTLQEVRREEEEELIATADALAKAIRPWVLTSKPFLFHGTRHAEQILRDNTLKCLNTKTSSVHFSRDLAVATLFALADTDSVGAILVINRDRLAQNYSLTCFRDPRLARGAYEADERVQNRDVIGLHKYVHDIIWIDPRRQQICSKNQTREGGKPINWPVCRESKTGDRNGFSSSHGPPVQTTDDVGEPTEMDAALERLLSSR